MLGLLALLGSVPLAGCEDSYGRRPGDFRDGSRADGWRGRGSRDRDGFWHGRHGRGATGGASDAGDAGLDDAGLDDAGAASGAGGAGLTADAGLGGSAPSTSADAGVGAAGAAGAGGADAVDPNVQALSDGQILQVADTLLGGSIEQMNASLPLLGDADVLGFAEQTLSEDSAAQSTLSALTAAIGASPTDSAVADEARTTNEAVLQELAAPDAGAIDARFMSAQLAAEARDLALLGQLIIAADAPVLRAQLVVLQALRQAQLERAQSIAVAL